jgi:hypothetical protein
MCGLKRAIMLDYVVSSGTEALETLLASVSRLFDVTDASVVRAHGTCFLIRTSGERGSTLFREIPVFVCLDGASPAVLQPEASQRMASACGTCVIRSHLALNELT